MRSPSARSSTRPFLNGVTIATNDPANIENLLTDVAWESIKMLKKVDYCTRHPKRAETRSFTRQGRRREKIAGVPLRYVEDFFDPRTQLVRGRVLARLGMGGCNGAFFSIFS